jgi:hypothetical protein
MSHAFTREMSVEEGHYGEPGFGENPAEAAARERIAQARAWQWCAALRGDLCEHRSATAALQRVCDELRQARTSTPDPTEPGAGCA